MSAEHRAPLAAFAVVAMIAGGVTVQSLGADGRPRVEVPTAVGSASSPDLPAGPDAAPEAAPPAGTEAPTPSSSASPTAAGTSGTSGPADPTLRPGGVPPTLPAGVVSAIPGLAAFLSGGEEPPPTWQPEQESPGVDLGSTSGPSPTPDPGPSGQPSPSDEPSQEPSPSGTPSGSPSPTASGDAERPIEPAPSSSSAPTP
ncbi:hypothetical protein [Nocardioides abyssi]|uniref:Uncharacterized protein n=1 Tax=Nocardioides abyssi TaxID=3058370 RepID=A0ABT8EQR4_9ACTN|nr:hypothetical protein [Nocardioides abyssi]MDN4160472.1 hypothetical protein [Nocardioides abyssi]